MKQRTYSIAGAPDLLLVIIDVGLACCALEVGSAISMGLLINCEDTAKEHTANEHNASEWNDTRPGETIPATTILLISGTVTDALAPAILRAWSGLPEPKRAVSFGACANTGGPYWDAPTVTKGVDQIVPIEVYVPGCPPRPEALIAGIMALAKGANP